MWNHLRRCDTLHIQVCEAKTKTKAEDSDTSADHHSSCCYRRKPIGTVVLWLVWAPAGVGSLADVSLHNTLALLAGDVAAPVVLAVAALHQLLRVRVVAAAAAHQVAAVAAEGGFVTLPESSIGRESRSDIFCLVVRKQRRLFVDGTQIRQTYFCFGFLPGTIRFTASF